jgi:hypothetical protein
VVELLRKDLGVDQEMLTNREKTPLANSLRSTHKLKGLLTEISMKPSSYQYQVEALKKPNKYDELRIRIAKLFA